MATTRSLIAHDHTCDGCNKDHIEGSLYICDICDDYSLCNTCYETEVHDLSHPFERLDRPWSHPLRLAPRSPTAHDCHCDGCDQESFDGTRYRCRICEDYDLCQDCYEGDKHDLTHEFLQIDHPRTPVPKVLAPRRPNVTSGQAYLEAEATDADADSDAKAEAGPQESQKSCPDGFTTHTDEAEYVVVVKQDGLGPDVVTV